MRTVANSFKAAGSPRASRTLGSSVILLRSSGNPSACAHHAAVCVYSCKKSFNS
jgi:hypothetical protein